MWSTIINQYPAFAQPVNPSGGAGRTDFSRPCSIWFEQYEAQNDNESDSNLKQLNQDTASAQTSGVTLTLLLAESHLCLHTWGEYQTVTMDVYVCNVANENSSKADALFNACLQLFQPKQHHVNSVSRQHQIPNNFQH